MAGNEEVAQERDGNGMKINMLLPSADLSGGVRVISIYADRLKRRGHDVTCISVEPRGQSLRRKVKSFVRGRGWPTIHRAAPSHMDSIDVKHHVVSPWRPIRDCDVPDGDVVLATWWETAEWANELSASKGAKAWLIQHHELLFQGQPVDRVAATWRMPLHKITISKWLTNLAREQYGDPNASHVPNSVDTEQFHATERGRQARPTVGLLYSATPFKGCEVSLEAIRLASKLIPDLQVISFGAEPVKKELPLPDGAEFHFRPQQDRIRDLYARCDVWLCGSRSEGFHLPPLEAMACRTPVVSTEVGGSMDVIENGMNGYVVAVDDAKSLADRLVEVLVAPEANWKAMSQAALSTATRYTWDDATRRLETALRVAIRRSELPGGFVTDGKDLDALTAALSV